MQNKNLTAHPTSARIFQRNGDFYKGGEIFKQPELASTLKRIAANPDDFYKGEMAKEIAAFVKAGGGIITAEDLADYQVKDRKPLTTTYHGYGVITSPPPSSGGIALIEIFNMLNGYNLSKLGPDRSSRPAGQIHIIAEIFRRAGMDKSQYLADPDFINVPIKQLSDPIYAAAFAKSIDPEKPTPSKDLVRPEGFLPPPPTDGGHYEARRPLTSPSRTLKATSSAIPTPLASSAQASPSTASASPSITRWTTSHPRPAFRTLLGSSPAP